MTYLLIAHYSRLKYINPLRANQTVLGSSVSIDGNLVRALDDLVDLPQLVLDSGKVTP
jgi:hypothetical protein